MKFDAICETAPLLIESQPWQPIPPRRPGRKSDSTVLSIMDSPTTSQGNSAVHSNTAGRRATEPSTAFVVHQAAQDGFSAKSSALYDELRPTYPVSQLDYIRFQLKNPDGPLNVLE